MEGAKALTGKRAGELIRASDPKLNHETCKAWKLYCPTCYQPVHFRKSTKISSYFAHYNFGDKSCPERFSAPSSTNMSCAVAGHEQDLEEVELFISQIFYGINPEYFQKVNLKESESNSALVEKSVAWFLSHIDTDLSGWVLYYCQNSGFLDWKDFSKEKDYLMDCLHILADRLNIFKDVICYCVLLLESSKFNLRSNQKKFGITAQKIQKTSLVSLVLLDLLIKRFGEVASRGIETDVIKSFAIRKFIDIKIPANTQKVIFKETFPDDLPLNKLSILVARRKSKSIFEYIQFRKEYKNQFWYFSLQDDVLDHSSLEVSEEILRKPRSNILRVMSSQLDSIHFQEREDKGRARRNNAPKFSENDLLELYIDQDGDLAVKGYIDKKYAKSVVVGIKKILFNRSERPMLDFLSEGLISEDIAQKAAQLLLQSEYGDMSASEALRKLESLSS